MLMPRIEFDYTNGLWVVALRKRRKGNLASRHEGTHWLITVAFAKALWSYINDF